MTHGPIPLEISSQQLALYKALSGKDDQLAALYYGGLLVLSQFENPDRLGLAAHGFRELMEKLPRYLDVPASAKNTNLTERVRTLNENWDKTRQRSKCHTDRGWSGDIDESLEKFLKLVHEFFEWVKIDRPKRKEQTRNTLRKLDLLGSLPAPIENLRVSEWDEIRSYFVKIAHHNEAANPAEFELWRSNLERFLLDLLVPRTFEDHATIDQILREADDNA